jgi:hypothetical protein
MLSLTPAQYDKCSIDPESETMLYCHRSARYANTYDALFYAGFSCTGND